MSEDPAGANAPAPVAAKGGVHTSPPSINLYLRLGVSRVGPAFTQQTLVIPMGES